MCLFQFHEAIHLRLKFLKSCFAGEKVVSVLCRVAVQQWGVFFVDFPVAHRAHDISFKDTDGLNEWK